MGGPDPAVASLRSAVRSLLDLVQPREHIAVACSGGADSLALAAASAHVAERRGITVHGLVVDHGLQAGSAEIARRAAAQLVALGVVAQVLPVRVEGPGGPEAAARRARYTALLDARPSSDCVVLLGHTLDDQAETVLLGLGRGSGARSIAGMRPLDPPWGRPLLGVRRSTTRAACAALGLDPWEDPHNLDPAFTRVRLRREVLPLLENVLHGGVAEALARTAAQVREDGEALDELAGALLLRAEDGHELEVSELARSHPAVRRRALRAWLLAGGVTEVTDAHLRSVDALVGKWRGQGGVALPGGLVAERSHGRLHLDLGGSGSERLNP
ncbi:tRNA lysidine(34) synthetase TilS [Allokutzneria albata]|uniref:tRNA(Ile)-lysidine synthase n=1 Tax=Allokutzneria albata TaxID=211114 RepID=A0A1H0AKP7_ALLAB|nr:tRNA lysidine(34) synthetase TilS [Allokutzneria albata]SDN33995.1 tRNA(Ile)-lysidine synthase [Allokutzneria albata]